MYALGCKKDPKDLRDIPNTGTLINNFKVDHK